MRKGARAGAVSSLCVHVEIGPRWAREEAEWGQQLPKPRCASHTQGGLVTVDRLCVHCLFPHVGWFVNVGFVSYFGFGFARPALRHGPRVALTEVQTARAEDAHESTGRRFHLCPSPSLLSPRLTRLGP